MGYKFIGLDRDEPNGLYIPASVDKWYSRSDRSWVVQLKDRLGNQIGEASYVATRKEADDHIDYLKRINGLK